MIKYVKGDATVPVGEGNKLIIHCCNNSGGWGRGFVLSLSRKWDRPEIEYRKWHELGYYSSPADSQYSPFTPKIKEKYSSVPFKLGQIQVVGVDPYVFVANMIGQENYYDFKVKVGDKTITLPPVRYCAIEECLMRVAVKAKELDATVHGPRLGSGLAKGNWDTVEEIINRVFIDNGIEVTIYDLV